jgi:hypothetical protein
MCNPDNTLQRFAEQIGRGGESPIRIRETLEASLIPLVRRVLRNGAGMPQLVQWVQRTLPHVQADADRTRPVDPERAAAPLARLLCATLLRKRPARPGVAMLDTIIGA